MAEPTCPAANCTGGLLDAADDLRVLWLSLRTDGHRTVAQSVLHRECVASPTPPLVGIVDVDLRRGAPVLYVPSLRVPWAAELKEQVRRHVGARVVPVSDPHCSLRARDVLDVLARPCYGARWRELVRSFYAPLRREYAAYNDDVVRALCAHGALARIANLVRLAYLNRLLGALRRRERTVRDERDRVRAAQDALSPRADRTTVAAAASRPRSPFSPPVLFPTAHPPPHAVKLRRFCLVHAVPVPDATRAPSAPPLDYIVGGICVPAHLLNEVEASLVRDYRLYFQKKEGAHARYANHPIVGSLASLALHGAALLDEPPVCNVISPLLEPLPASVAPPPSTSSSASQTPPSVRAPAPPAPLPPLRLGAAATALKSPPGTSAPSPRHLKEHRSVDAYLRSCFGIGWTSVCNAAIRNARRQLRERELVRLCGALACVQEALSVGDELRRELVEKAVEEDKAASGLAGACAISLAQKLDDDQLAKLEAQVPASVMRKVRLAKERLASLFSEDILSDAVMCQKWSI